MGRLRRRRKARGETTAPAMRPCRDARACYIVAQMEMIMSENSVVRARIDEDT